MIEWFNYYGLIIMVLMMVPNIIFAITHKNNQPQVNKTIEALEQVGRYGRFALMIFNILFVCSGFYFESAELVYLVTNGILICRLSICEKHEKHDLTNKKHEKHEYTYGP